MPGKCFSSNEERVVRAGDGRYRGCVQFQSTVTSFLTGILFAMIVQVSLPLSVAHAKIRLAQAQDPACEPTPTPIPFPRPRPSPIPDPTPRPSATPVANPTPVPTPGQSPAPSPTPRPSPTPIPYPKPPANLPPDGPDPESTGVGLLDRALAGQAPKSLLPLWHDYPWRKNARPKLWTSFLISTLRSDGASLVGTLPADIELFCPRYANLDSESRLIFWARLISVVAEQESSFNSFDVTHAPTIGPKVFSTGFFMLSLTSARSSVYGCDMIRTQDDLFDWRKNMGCAIRIMSQLVRRDQAIAWNPKAAEPERWQGVARYWSTARDRRLKTELGRHCVNELIRARLPDWEKEANESRHPSYRDEEYREAGEIRYERLLRHINQLPICR